MVVESDSDEEKVSEDAAMPTGGRTWVKWTSRMLGDNKRGDMRVLYNP